MHIQPIIQTDYYKIGHPGFYPEGLNQSVINLTPRKSRISTVNHVVVFGIQYLIKEYFIKQWNENFFQKDFKDIEKKYLRLMDNTLGKGVVSTHHLKELHDLQFIPLHVKALPEGSLCPIRVPCAIIYSSLPEREFGWLPGFFETIISCTTWQAMTSATLAHEFRKIFDKYGRETVGNVDFSQWQGHDFSMRGMSSLETACLSGAGHLLSFTGTDTIPAIEWLEQYYNADVEKELVGSSVMATEHSVACLDSTHLSRQFIGIEPEEERLALGETEHFRHLLTKFPKGILSMVSDTWSLPRVVTRILPELKELILSRQGKLVIRPDSFWTTPADCLCGFDGYHPQMNKLNDVEKESVRKGLIQSLWDIFGGIKSSTGYQILDSHIGAIYGDSTTLSSSEEICRRLKDKGFASINTVLGIGSYTYQYNTRDTFGFAIKATYGEVMGMPTEVFKDPVTDDGMKKSAKGLLQVIKVDGEYKLNDQVSWEDEGNSELKTVFLNGKLLKDWTLQEVRNNLASYRQ